MAQKSYTTNDRRFQNINDVVRDALNDRIGAEGGTIDNGSGIAFKNKDGQVMGVIGAAVDGLLSFLSCAMMTTAWLLLCSGVGA